MAAAPGVRRSELGDALRACRSAFIGVGAMSCMINLLYLTGSLFMLEVYDRVLPSRSVPTLVGLAILAGGLYIAQGVLDLIRSRILGRIGTSLDDSLNARVFDTIVRLPLMVGARNEGLQPLRDLDNVRSFLSSMGPGALFDLPWLPSFWSASRSSPNTCRALRRARPWVWRRAEMIWPPPAGATPKCWWRWECPGG
jgi:ABC-type protease/lipase transport system fused ATPase/permease subunit